MASQQKKLKVLAMHGYL
jgi:Serine hydrolase (FSH1)